MPEEDLDAELEETIAAFSPPQFPIHMSEEDTPTKSIVAPTAVEGVARSSTVMSTASSASSVEPLSIKKKSSIKPRRQSPDSFRRIPVHEPSSPTHARSLRSTSITIQTPPRRSSRIGSRKGSEVDRMVIVAKTTKEDVCSFTVILTNSNDCSYHLRGEPLSGSSKRLKYLDKMLHETVARTADLIDPSDLIGQVPLVLWAEQGASCAHRQRDK